MHFFPEVKERLRNVEMSNTPLLAGQTSISLGIILYHRTKVILDRLHIRMSCICKKIYI